MVKQTTFLSEPDRPEKIEPYHDPNCPDDLEPAAQSGSGRPVQGLTPVFLYSRLQNYSNMIFTFLRKMCPNRRSLRS